LPYCLKCGAKLEKKKFVDAWNADGKPTDISEDLYCTQCGSRFAWPPEKADPKDMLENWKSEEHKFRGQIKEEKNLSRFVTASTPAIAVDRFTTELEQRGIKIRMCIHGELCITVNKTIEEIVRSNCQRCSSP